MTCNNELCREAVDALRHFRDAYVNAPGHLRLDQNPLGATLFRADALIARIDAASDEEDV